MRSFFSTARIVPVYFALLEKIDRVSSAIGILNTFLLQYIAFRRGEPAVFQSSPLSTICCSWRPPPPRMG